MTVLGHAESPLGTLLLSGDGEALTGLWFLGQKYEGAGLPENAPTDEGLPVFETARAWLRAYFAGEALPELPPLRPAGTDFQIPCHRVVGSSGSLTGYAGGVERKAFLLALEGENHAG